MDKDNNNETESSLWSLFESREKIFPAIVKGRYRSLKWYLMALLLSIYYASPWLRWDRGENYPDQAVLIDIANRKFYFFFIEIWPQEIYVFFGMLIIAAIALFLVTSIFGRVWCGFACPQTIWTDLFMLVERYVEGDKNARAKLDKKSWTFNKSFKRILKHLIWLIISILTGAAFVFYFGNAPTMLNDIFHFELGYAATFWLIALTISTYLLAGFSREQVCTYMCPYSRFQGAMYDKNTLLVAYAEKRGEPRGKKSVQDAGDCVDCSRCVAVCPTGIDIRDGSQYQCINCGLCVDACNDIMGKLNRPKNLIRFDTLNNIDNHNTTAKISDYISLKNPRAIVYLLIIIILSSVLLYSITIGRKIIDITVIKARTPLYVQMSDGNIRNTYKIHITNKSKEELKFNLYVHSKFKNSYKILNKNNNIINALPDTLTAHKIYVDSVESDYNKGSNKLDITITNDNYNITYKTTFNTPK